jgi:thiamine biosynthesis lipoprotein
VATTAALIAAVSWLTPASSARQLARHEASRLSMACVYAIEAYGPDRDGLPRIVEAALDEVDRIDRLMSHYKTGSELSRVNREAASGPVAVPPELFALLSDAMRYARETDGAFDVTVGPLMKAWGFFGGSGHLPEPRALAAARGRVGYRHVVLDAATSSIRFDRAGVELDLGGIAKGYAVDRAVGVLQERGAVSALVSAGGSTIYALGAPPGRAGWELSIQDPIDSRRMARHIVLRDRALSIAGHSEKAFESGGRTYSHIMDPRTGEPAQGILSVAVLAPDGTSVDALDNALFVLGPDRSRVILGRSSNIAASFFLPAGPRAWTVVDLPSSAS